MTNKFKLRYIIGWPVILLVILFFYRPWESKSPRAYEGIMESNHPWMVFDPTMEQGLVSPWGDKQDPDVVYLAFVMKNGNSVRINLKTKEIKSYHFNVARWEDIQNQTNRYILGQNFDAGPSATLWTEFRGKKEERIVDHMYGYPVPNKPGKLKTELRTGYYYIMDERNGVKYELLRVKVINSDMDFGSLGTTQISPNKKWVVFTLPNGPSRTFIFNREEKTPVVFATNHEDQALEVWK